MRFLTSCISTLLFVARAAAYPSPESCTGSCYSHDPSVVLRESDGAYFRFETGGHIGIWKADALEGPWKSQGFAITNGSTIDHPGKDELWAPDVHLLGDKYILYYAVSTYESQNSTIGYATSPTMEEGSWTDHGSAGISSTDGGQYNAIDANLIQASGTNVLTFGSFWDGIFQVEMSKDGGNVTSSLDNIAYNSTGAHAIEGSYVFYWKDYYYLFFSSGLCCEYNTDKPPPGEEYKIFACRSENVDGPYVDKDDVNCLDDNGGTMILGSHGEVLGPGGQGIIDDPTHGPVIYYHYANTSIGLDGSDYQFGWNVLDWSGGWPSI